MNTGRTTNRGAGDCSAYFERGDAMKSELFTVHATLRNGACISYHGLSEHNALLKVESFYKRRLESRSVAEDGREAGASFKNLEGRWTWYHENFQGISTGESK